MANLNWKRARKLRLGEYEEKYEPGKVLANGRVVPTSNQGSLASRAAKAEEEWLAARAVKRRKNRAVRRARNKRPSRAEQMRLKMIRQQLTPFE